MEKRARIYQIRQNILKALKEYDLPCRADDLLDFPGFLFLHPVEGEIAEQFRELRQAGYLTPCEGFDGEYCVTTQAGVRQIQPEFAKDVFVWGPRALRGYGLVVAIAAAILLSGCVSLQEGEVKIIRSTTFGIIASYDPVTNLPEIRVGWNEVQFMRTLNTPASMEAEHKDISIFTGQGSVSRKIIVE